MDKKKILFKTAKTLVKSTVEELMKDDSKENLKQKENKSLSKKFSDSLFSKIKMPNVEKLPNAQEEKINPMQAAIYKKQADEFMSGQKVNRDVLKAFELYKKAAEFGDVESMNIVGNMYYNCEEIFLQDNENAFKWYQKAANLNHVNAMYNLANMYLKGEGVKKNSAEAIKYFQKAAELGDIASINKLGEIYYEGKEIKQDRHEAFKWFRKSADLGNAEGMRNLAMMYFNEGGTNNYQQALNYFKRAADLGNADAMADISFMYQNGFFVKKDLDKAYHWLKKAAENGSPNGMFNFGIYTAQQKNYYDALNWLSAAYEKSDGISAGQIAYNISRIYKKIGDDKSGFFTNLLSSDNGDAELKKAEEWLGISKKLKYDPPKNPTKNNSSSGFGDVINGVGAIGELVEGTVIVAGVIGYTIYGICSLIFEGDN